MDTLIVATVGFILGGPVPAFVVVRVADRLSESRARLLADAAVFNARMAVQGDSHVWIVPAPSQTERAVYRCAALFSTRWRTRSRTAGVTRRVMGATQ